MTRHLASIPVGKILVPDDALRTLDKGGAEALGAMMAEEGQVEPIEVATSGDGYVLVFGLHRLEGARKAGLAEILALVDETGDEGGRRRRAIHENLGRRELNALDRALHLAQWKVSYEASHAVSRHGGDRRQGASRQFGDLNSRRFSETAAERLGIGERSIQRAISIAEGLSTSSRQRLALTRFADSQSDLELLARQAEPRQVKILDLLLAANSDVGSVAEAIAVLEGDARPSEADRNWQLAQNGWARLTAKQRDTFFAEHEAEFVEWQRRRKGKR